jgi:hypothetical protein
MALSYNFGAILYQQYHFIFYDLAIHSIAIGFIGTTIALYLPLMLPPIIGKTINFVNLNKIPIFLIILSLGLRGLGDYVLSHDSFSSFSSLQGNTWAHLSIVLKYSLGLSGWLIVAAMFVFVGMVHKSMNGVSHNAAREEK